MAPSSPPGPGSAKNPHGSAATMNPVELPWQFSSTVIVMGPLAPANAGREASKSAEPTSTNRANFTKNLLLRHWKTRVYTCAFSYFIQEYMVISPTCLRGLPGTGTNCRFIHCAEQLPGRHARRGARTKQAR